MSARNTLAAKAERRAARARPPELFTVHESGLTRRQRRDRLRGLADTLAAQIADDKGRLPTERELRECQRVARMARVNGDPGTATQGFGEYGRNLRKWADRRAAQGAA